ncbi:MAG TPA: DUF1579 family protein [Terriglobia bacterium]|nr:DUF1579 family protein [Terriglobia bacterium]
MPTRMLAAAALVLASSLAARQLPAASQTRQFDARDPLKIVAVYSGRWHSEDETFDTQFSKASKESVEIANTCSTDGEFYVCHQQVSKPSGPAGAMVIFLWNAKDRLIDTYVMQSTGGNAYHGHLVMAGDTWTWQAAAPDKSAPTQWRTLNTFSGTDHIVYQTQFSSDGGEHWTTTRQGKETRVVP